MASKSPRMALRKSKLSYLLGGALISGFVDPAKLEKVLQVMSALFN